MRCLPLPCGSTRIALRDDISVLVLKVMPRAGDDVRRMTIRLPISA